MKNNHPTLASRCLCLLWALIGVSADGTLSHAQMPTVQRSAVELDRPPLWLYPLQNIRLIQPADGRLELLDMSVATNDHGKQAALVGEFRNAGEPLAGVS